MATVAFQVAGSVIGAKIAAAYSLGTVGTAIATAIGSIIGAGIGNELFPQKAATERYDDVNVTNSAYGLPIPLVYAEQNRISGNVIWSSGLNETVNKKKVGTFPARTTLTSYTYDVSFAIGLAEGECRNINRVWFNKKLAWDRSAYSGSTPDFTPWTVTTGIFSEQLDFASMAFYPGNFTQTPDPTIEAELGAGNVPAYRGTCYLVFKNLQLADYGNTLPLVEVEIEGAAPSSAGAIIEDICERSGLLSDEFVVDQSLYEEPVRGYLVTAAGNGINSMNPLLTAYGAIPSEHAGTVRVVSRNTGAVATIDIDDMGGKTRADNADTTYPLSVFRAPDVDLPREVSITFYDLDRDYQSGTQRSQRSIGNPESVVGIEFPITFTADEAKKIADRALYEPYLQRITAQFSTSDQFEFLYPGDLVLIKIANRYRPIRISRITRGANNVLEFEGFSDDQVVFGGSTVGIEGVTPVNELRVTDDSVGYLFNAPLISTDQKNSGYIATVDNPAAFYPGATLYYSIDDSEFNEAFVWNDKAIIGSCTTTLGSPPSTEDVIDMSSTVTVTLTKSTDTLDSVTDDELLNGANAAWVGRSDGSRGEIIQFKTATLVTPGTYTLSGLLRGRRATEHESTAHVASEKFVLLDVWADIDYSESDVNKSRFYKFVTNTVDPASVSSVSFTNTGEGGKARTVGNLTSFRDSSNDVTVSWIPRTRFFPPGLGYGPVDLVDPESYEVDITNSAYTTVYRTISTTSRTITYTAAEATADGLTPSATRYGIIYFVNAVRGRGHGKRFVIS